MNKKLAVGVQVTLGFLLGVALNAGFIWLESMRLGLVPVGSWSRGFDLVWFYTLILIGAVQLIWQIPVVLLLRWRGQKMMALGVILVASLTALLNATCWGFFFAGKIRIGG